MEFCVYILCSEAFPDKIYTGFTSHLILRMQQHNHSNFDNKAHTKKFRPWKVIYLDFYELKADALSREKWLKSGAGREWIKLNKSSW